DGRGRCHDNIFVERLWWTVKHEWVYLRPAASGIEQNRSLAEFFDWYNLRRPHQALGWRTPNEAYLGQSTTVTVAITTRACSSSACLSCGTRSTSANPHRVARSASSSCACG